MNQAFLLISLSLSTSGMARSRTAPYEGSSVDWATVQTPVNGEVCFSPDEPCDIKLTKFIQSAKTSLDIAVFDINLDSVVHNILVQTRKVKVRIVVDKRQAHGKNSAVALLVRAGAQVRYGHQRGIMHDKFTVVDGQMIETGSFNYTNHAYSSNQENQIYLNDPKVVRRFADRFERIWETGTPTNEFSVHN